jgi:uncharacterized membrane protein
MVVNTAAALPTVLLIPYLALLFTEPLRFILYRRRKYGVVYNSLTKQPIDLAIVRLYSNKTNKLVTTKVTDTKGRYSFVAEPGEYYIKIQHKDYIFPSDILGQRIRDLDYADLYYGASITITNVEPAINLNIPLDPNFKVETDKKVLTKFRWRKIQQGLSYLGPIAAGLAVIIIPNWWVVGFFAAHLVLFFLFRRLALVYAPKSYGVTTDAHSRKALENTVVRLFDIKYNKLLATQVTNQSGKYNFLVGPNIYYLTASRPTHETYQSEHLDYTTQKEAVIDRDITLHPRKSNGQSAVGSATATPPPPPSVPAASTEVKSISDITPPSSEVPPQSPTVNG